MPEKLERFDTPDRPPITPPMPDVYLPPAALDLKPPSHVQTLEPAAELLPVIGNQEGVSEAPPAILASPTDVPAQDHRDAYDGGGDTPKEPPPLPPTANGETGGEEPLDRLYDLCMHRAQEIQAHTRATSETHLVRGAQLEHAIHRAVRTEDKALLDASVGELTTLPASADERVVPGMLEVLKANDTATTFLALERIDQALRAEQARVRDTLRNEDTSRRTALATPQLNAVVASDNSNYLSPDEWFDQYAANPEQAWLQKMDHHLKTGIPDDTPEAAAERQAHIDVVATSLANPDAFSDEFFLRNARRALHALQDPAARADLVERYEEMVLRMRHSERGLQPDDSPYLIQTIIEVMEDPDLATADNAAFAREIIPVDDEGYTLGVNWHQFIEETLRLRAALLEHDGHAPATIAVNIVNWGAAMIPNLPRDLASGEEEVRNAVDLALLRNATRHAARGNLVGAAEFIHRITDDYTRVGVLHECLDHVTSQEEIDRLRVLTHREERRTEDDFIVDPLDDIDIYERRIQSDHLETLVFSFARARLAGDTGALAAIAVRSSQPPLVNYRNWIAADVAQQAYQLVAQQDPTQKVSLARSILAGLRQSPDADYFTRPYSEALIRAGDAREAEETFLDITAEALSHRPSDQIFLYLWLADLLNQVR